MEWGTNRWVFMEIVLNADALVFRLFIVRNAEERAEFNSCISELAFDLACCWDPACVCALMRCGVLLKFNVANNAM